MKFFIDKCFEAFLLLHLDDFKPFKNTSGCQQHFLLYLRWMRSQQKTNINNSSCQKIDLIQINGIEFALAAQPKNLPMHQPLENLEIKVLEKMYLREIEVLKFKLLNGALWKDILKQKNRAIELALVIHKKQCNKPVSSNRFSVEEVNY